MIVVPASRVEKLIEDRSAFFEGPVWVDDESGGHLKFTDIAGDAIVQWSPTEGLSIFADNFVERSPVSEPRHFHIAGRDVTLIGPNGLTRNHDGSIIYCGYGQRHVGKIDMAGEVQIIAEFYNGRRLNTPNDVVVKSSGEIYFTDSSADSVRSDEDPRKGHPFSAVYRIVRGQVELLDDDGFGAANGLAFSPDEKAFYVNDTWRKLIHAYSVADDGTLKDRRLFADLGGDDRPGVPDGMKVDAAGRVYCTGPGGLWILDPSGDLCGLIETDERLTNITFGGPERQFLYMTGPSYVWRVDRALLFADSV
ncbi:SMP-30/gluconolactonase/LRE family protein [Ancylobacter sp. IITR112]|uniref:SMP-30/gluconolactonase/LRE family protein n=1 Tax=Ancylobacter sp. IITR112 TaxID=3138073 RepID=UPI00352A7915